MRAPALRRRAEPPASGGPRVGSAAAAAALAVCASLALLAQAAPLAPLPAHLKPDLFWAVLAFFALRRPDAAPLALVAALVILRDAVLGGPPGAGALTLLLGTEMLRLRARRMPPPRSVWGDWAAASTVFGAALAVQWLMLKVSFAAAPPPVALIPGAAATAAAIPPVAAFLRYGLRLGAAARPAREAGA